MMLPMLFLFALLLTVLLSLIAFVQLLYLESLRLRTRDLPALEFFKQKLEEQLGMKTETGVLSFSLIKYCLMPLIAILILDVFCAGGPISWSAFFESAVAACLCMLVAACIVPYLLYRDTSGEWLAPLAPLLKTLALTVRPVVYALEFLESVTGQPAEQPEATRCGG